MNSTGNLQKLWEVYEKDGKYYFDAFEETMGRHTFGPYSDRDKAECDLAQADAMY